MMSVDQSSQIRADLTCPFEPCEPRRRVLIFLRHIGALGVVLEITVEADGEQVPGAALITDKDQILRSPQPALIGVFHLPFPIQFGLLAGEGLKYLHVKERSL